jgi:hypothetical protein
VVHHLIAQVNAGMHKKHPQQIDSRESMKRQKGCPHNFHSGKVTQFLAIGFQFAAVSYRQGRAFNMFLEPKTIRKQQFIAHYYGFLS